MQSAFLLLVLCAQGGDGKKVGDNSAAEDVLLQSLLAISPAVSTKHDRGLADRNAPARHRRAQTKMQSVKELRERSESVAKSKQITEAMRLVAASRVKKATDASLMAKPFVEGLEDALAGLVATIDPSDRQDIPALKSREVKKVALIVVAGDRGLCGGFNAKILKAADARIAELKKQGLEVELVTVGVKAVVYFRRKAKVIFDTKMGDPNSDVAAEIGDDLLSAFFSEDIDRVELLYTKFISMTTSEPIVQTLLPFTDLKTTPKEGGDDDDDNGDVELDSAADVLIDDLGSIFLSSLIFNAFQDSTASELAARVIAMQAATDNANELYDLLILKMNRKRQARITAEISEICAGAAAGEDEGGD
jgi:F-type H+-transporting ATPase subunit gamma